jgi:hypothetical protein
MGNMRKYKYGTLFMQAPGDMEWKRRWRYEHPNHDLAQLMVHE